MCCQDIINRITGMKGYAELYINYKNNRNSENWKTKVIYLATNCQSYLTNLSNFIDSQTWFDSSTPFTQNSIDPKSSHSLSINQQQGTDSELINIYNQAIDGYYKALAKLGYKESLDQQVGNMREDCN